MLDNIMNFLGGGWLSVALSVILAAAFIWYAIFKKNFERKKAEEGTQKERENTSDEQKKKAKEKEDEENRKKIDDFLK